MGSPKKFLNINIKRDFDKQIIKLSHTKFIDKMLIRFGFEKCNPRISPMNQSDAASCDRKKREEDEYTEERIPNCLYREAVGSLLYLAGESKPDISYSVNVLSRHQVNTTNNEWNTTMNCIYVYLDDSEEKKSEGERDE